MLGVVVDAYNKSVPINTEMEDKKTNLNLNNKNNLLHWFITFPEGVYGGKGGKAGTVSFGLREKSWKIGNWIFGKGGIFSDFGFGLREKSWKFGFLVWGMGGDSATSDLDLGKKVGNLDFWGGYSPTSDLDLGKKVGNLDFGGGWGGILQLRIWT